MPDAESAMPRFPSRSLLILLYLVIFTGGAIAQDETRPFSKIAFGSCADQDKPLPIFEKIADAKPDLLVLLGDNIYADIATPRDKVDPTVIKEAYERLAKLPSWQRLRSVTPILAIWDDHDYGINDAGAEWKFKDESKQLMLDFFNVPADSPRRSRPGAYAATVVGPPGQRVQIILLDMRYFRAGLEKARLPYGNQIVSGYRPTDNPEATFLGAEQWKWLEEQLKQPAELRLIGSGVQLVSDEHPFEKWANIPAEREKLYELIRSTGANGVVVLSGDRHLADMSVDAKSVGYPLYDVTSSGLNQGSEKWRAPEKNSKRVGGMPWGDNFGMVEIDWSKPDPLVSLKLLDVNGETAVKETIPLSLLKPSGDLPPKLALAPGSIGPRDAVKKKVGDEVLVQLTVQAGRKFSDKLLLNSERDYRSDDNFTIVITGAAYEMGKWKGADLDVFKDKTIRVKGTIAEYNGKPQIQVRDEGQIEIVE